MTEQVSLLTHALDVAIEKVAHLDEISEMLREMGSRHVSYGVEPQQYASVRDSLIWALAQTVGAERWSLETDRSVGWVIDQVSTAMLESDSEGASATAS